MSAAAVDAAPGAGDLAADLDAALGAAVRLAWGDPAERADAPPESALSHPCPAPVYAALRRGGRRLDAAWLKERDLTAAMGAVAAMERFGEADTVEVCLTGDFRRVRKGAFRREFSNVHRGVRGVEFRYAGALARHAPTEMLAHNRSFEKVFRRFLERVGISESRFHRRGGIIRRFAARQYLLAPGPRPAVTPIFRGARVVEMADLSGAVLADMIEGMGRWLVANVAEDGRMTYKYWPSRGTESTADNTIRQFMATVCLLRLAEHTGAPEARRAAEANLAHNLRRFYRLDDGVGIIEHEGKAKLGAAALAALALLEYPGDPRPYADAFARLRRGIDALWRPDGSFRTFHRPAERNDNQNFYPGEALLFWASLAARGPDAEVVSRCLRSFAYYRDWHRRNRNPAFVPWHTQAYALLYALTGEPELKDFIFEMNDWLLPLQQWEAAPYPDLRGRFFDPEHPEYGPPHASSTGVYLEGLAEAYRLARDEGDEARAAAYRRAIWRGVRNLRQLQFVDDVDMYYVSKKDRVAGAVRTETYNNEIRVDNVQHALMALLKLRRLPEFADAPAPA